MQKKWMWLLVVAMLVISAPQAVFGDGAPDNSGDNLVKNGGFEEQLSFWNIPQGTAIVDSNVIRSDSNSLFYENNDPDQYELFMQDIPANAGETIYFSVWIKGEDIEQQTGLPPTSEDGAAIFIQSYDANNHYIDGVFPAGVLGTFDWTEVKGKAIIPPNAARVSIGLYLRPQTVGKVWFDDVSVQREMPQLIKTYLTYPNYRQIALNNNTESWKVSVVNQLPVNETGFSIRHEVRNDNNQSLFMQALPILNSNLELQFQPTAPLPTGKYTWLVELLDSQQQIRKSEEYEVTVQQKMPQIYIDREGFTVINDEKFFPLGTYLIRDWSHSSTNLQKIADAGFNTLLSYTYGEAADAVQFLDRADQYGFKVIYNLVDIYLGDEANNRSDGKDPFEIAAQYITDLKDHPALLAWYINDEFDLGWMPELERMYQLIKELDPNHPVLQVSNTMGILEEYYPVTDVLATDPYPVGDQNGQDTDLTMTSTFAKHTANVTRGAKGMWMVAQMHDLSVYYDWRVPNQPNAEEMLNQAYQDLIHGSKGLIFYSFFDLWFPDRNRLPDEDTFLQNWPYVLQMMEELETTIPVIMENHPVSLTVLDANPSVEIAAFEHNQQLHLIMANPYYEASSVTVALPQGWKVQNPIQGDISSTNHPKSLTFQLPAIGSGVFVLEQDVPDQAVTRAEFTVMLINALQLKDKEGVLKFTDSEQIDSRAMNAIAQALQLGIVRGYKDGSFRPDRPITRAEMAVMIARGLKTEQSAEKETSFADDDSIPGWAKQAVEVGRSAGIWHGRSNNRFMPHAQATYAEAETLLLRLLAIQE